MAKAVKAKVKIRIPGGSATPAPPVATALGPHQISIMNFCKQFNAETASRKGEIVPVEVTIYKDKSFDFVIKTAPTSDLIMKKAGIKKGASRPQADKAGEITWADVEEIAKIKLPDLNATELEQAKKIVAGSAKSMGVEVIEK